MKAVIDTCVIVDALQSREPFCHDAQKIFYLCADRQFDGFITAKSVTDLYYLVHRQTHKNDETRGIIGKLCSLFGILDTTEADIRSALLSETADFEDGVMIRTAVRCGMDCIVTRNIRDYRKAGLPVYTPGVFLNMVGQKGRE